MVQLGEEASRNFTHGFDGEALGMSVGAAIAKGLGHSLPSGLGAAFGELHRQLEHSGSGALNAQAAFDRYTNSLRQVEEAQRRVSVAEEKLSNLRAAGAQMSAQMAASEAAFVAQFSRGAVDIKERTEAEGELQKQRQQGELQSQRVTSAEVVLANAIDNHTQKVQQSATAHERYNEQLEKTHRGLDLGAIKTVAFTTAITGLTVAAVELAQEGLHAVVEGFEKIVELGAKAGEAILGIGEKFQDMNRELLLYTGASGDELAGLEKSLRNVYANLDVSAKGLPETFATLHRQLGLSGDELERVGKQVQELEQRFHGFDTHELTTLIHQFGAEGEGASKVMEQLVGNVQRTGVSMRGLTNDLVTVGPVFEQLGININSATYAMADIERLGDPARQIMLGLSATAKEMAKAPDAGAPGGTFKQYLLDTMQTIQNLKDAGGDKLADAFAMKEFNVRSWTILLQTLKGLQEATEGRHAEGLTVDLEQLIEQSRTLHDKFTLFVQDVEARFSPLGLSIIQHLGGALDWVQHWFDNHQPEILGKITEWGDKFIDMLPTIQKFAGEATKFFGEFVTTAVRGVGFIAEALGDLFNNPKLEAFGAKITQFDMTPLTDKVGNAIENGFHIDTGKLHSWFDGTMSEVLKNPPKIDIKTDLKGPDGISLFDDKKVSSKIEEYGKTAGEALGKGIADGATKAIESKMPKWLQFLLHGAGTLFDDHNLGTQALSLALPGSGVITRDMRDHDIGPKRSLWDYVTHPVGPDDDNKPDTDKKPDEPAAPPPPVGTADGGAGLGPVQNAPQSAHTSGAVQNAPQDGHGAVTLVGKYSVLPSAPDHVGGIGEPAWPGPSKSGGRHGGSQKDPALIEEERQDRIADAQDSLDDAKDRAEDARQKAEQAEKELAPKVAEEQKNLHLYAPSNRADAEKQLEQDTLALSKARHEATRSAHDQEKAERALKEATDKAAEPMSGSGGQGGGLDSNVQKFGQSLVSGLMDELGFGSIFGKPPTEWGIFKMLGGGLSWGLNMLNNMGDQGVKFKGLGGQGAGAHGLMPNVDPRNLMGLGSEIGALPGPVQNAPGSPGGPPPGGVSHHGGPGSPDPNTPESLWGITRPQGTESNQWGRTVHQPPGAGGHVVSDVRPDIGDWGSGSGPGGWQSSGALPGWSPIGSYGSFSGGGMGGGATLASAHWGAGAQPGPGQRTPGPVTLAGNDRGSIANYIYRMALNRGYSPHDATAVVAYAIGESGLNPRSAPGRQGDDNVVGLFQEKTAFSHGLTEEQRMDPAANVNAYLNQLDQHPGDDIYERLGATSVGGPMRTGGRGLGPREYMDQLFSEAQGLIDPNVDSSAGMMPQVPGLSLGAPGLSPGVTPASFSPASFGGTLPPEADIAAAAARVLRNTGRVPVEALPTEAAGIIASLFPEITDIGGTRMPGPGTAPGTHDIGRTLDVMMPYGSQPEMTTPKDLALGNTIYDWLAAHAPQLGIGSMIWQDKGHNFMGGLGRGDAGSSWPHQAGHMNHIDVQFAPPGYRPPQQGFARGGLVGFDSGGEAKHLDWGWLGTGISGTGYRGAGLQPGGGWVKSSETTKISGSYSIKSGDTLSDIARRSGVSVADIAKANGITDPNMIAAGQTLKLPGTASGPIKPGGLPFPWPGQAPQSASVPPIAPWDGSPTTGSPHRIVWEHDLPTEMPMSRYAAGEDPGQRTDSGGFWSRLIRGLTGFDSGGAVGDAAAGPQGIGDAGARLLANLFGAGASGPQPPSAQEMILPGRYWYDLHRGTGVPPGPGNKNIQIIGGGGYHPHDFPSGPTSTVQFNPGIKLDPSNTRIGGLNPVQAGWNAFATGAETLFRNSFDLPRFATGGVVGDDQEAQIQQFAGHSPLTQHFIHNLMESGMLEGHATGGEIGDAGSGWLFNGEGPQYYGAALEHNLPFATPSTADWQTRLSLHEEVAFQNWARSAGAEVSKDYDMRGFWRSIGSPASGGPQRYFPDTFKTPYDTTFSRESQYAVPGTPFVWRNGNLVDLRGGLAPNIFPGDLHPGAAGGVGDFAWGMNRGRPASNRVDNAGSLPQRIEDSLLHGKALFHAPDPQTVAKNAAQGAGWWVGQKLLQVGDDLLDSHMKKEGDPWWRPNEAPVSGDAAWENARLAEGPLMVLATMQAGNTIANKVMGTNHSMWWAPDQAVHLRGLDLPQFGPFGGDIRQGMGFAAGGVSPPGPTDTVPAMLTPGEVVLSKRAVDMIGLDNALAINSLGLAGGGVVPLGFDPGGQVPPGTMTSTNTGPQQHLGNGAGFGVGSAVNQMASPPVTQNPSNAPNVGPGSTPDQKSAEMQKALQKTSLDALGSGLGMLVSGAFADFDPRTWQGMFKQPQAVTYDQSVHITGNTIADPQGVQNAIAEKQNQRTYGPLSSLPTTMGV